MSFNQDVVSPSRAGLGEKYYGHLPYSCFHSLQISGRNLASKHQKLYSPAE